ncbi:hypothetical protein [Limnofasciculus baicalensis]|nr:hypothetical protein [Limnofasciculus baicalensis]
MNGDSAIINVRSAFVVRMSIQFSERATILSILQDYAASYLLRRVSPP